jgi:cytochrome c oxidase assembly factor CtaG
MSASDVGRGPSGRTWLLAALEVIGALVLARVIVWTGRDPMSQEGHAMGPMPGMPGGHGPDLAWSWPVYAIATVASAAAIWWLLSRRIVAAILAAVTVTMLAASTPVRMLAAQSHLIAMVALEVLMVVVPLLVVTILPRLDGMQRVSRRRGGWTCLTVGSAVVYAAALIAIHLPAVHHRLADTGSAPVWVVLVAPLIGIGYWFGVLRTQAVVPVRTRRAVLLGAQEVAAFIGLLSVFGAWSTAAHHSSLGISAAWDQRLGGVFMMVTCAAVAIPIARRLR